jgi:hypothetical protein
MQYLSGHGETDEIPPLVCALERGRPELLDKRMLVRDAALSPEIGREESGSGFAGHWAYGIARKRGVCMVQTRVSPVQFLTCSVTASGPMRRPAAGSLFCFDSTPSRNNRAPGTPDCIALRVTVSICDGPSVNAELRPWESRPLA